jgi:hypothetical protein
MAPTERIDMKKGYNPPPKDKPENPYIPPGPPLIETAYKEKKRGTMTADEVIKKLLSVCLILRNMMTYHGNGPGMS